MPWRYQFLIIVGAAVGVSCGLYFLVYKAMDDSNRTKGESLAAKQAEVEQLRPYQGKLLELTRNIESLKQQLELQRRIVPDEKLSEGLIQLMQSAAIKRRDRDPSLYVEAELPRRNTTQKFLSNWKSMDLITRC